jgi:hypothetical protein
VANGIKLSRLDTGPLARSSPSIRTLSRVGDLGGSEAAPGVQEKSNEQAAMPEAGDLQLRNTVACQQRRQY